MNELLTSLEEQYQEQKDIPGGLSASLREMAWKKANALGLPTKKSETYKYVPLKSFFQTSSKKVRAAQLRISELDDRLIVSGLQDAEMSYGMVIQNQVRRALSREKDPFVLFNIAAHNEGTFIYVPPDVEIDKPLRLSHIMSDGQIHSRVQLFVGRGSSLSIISDLEDGSSGESWLNGILDIVLEEGARLTHTSLLFSNSWIFDHVRVTAKKDASFSHTSVTSGSKTVMQDVKVVLAGEGSGATIKGLSGTKDKSESHFSYLVEHVAPNCVSDQHVKGILSGKSRMSFEGKIYIHKEAQQTRAYQLNNNLLLSDGAVAYSRPNLEIFADDVKASHGSTTAQIDAEECLYLRTRGISEDLAKQLMVKGFALELIKSIPHEDVVDRLLRWVNDYAI